MLNQGKYHTVSSVVAVR